MSATLPPEDTLKDTEGKPPSALERLAESRERLRLYMVHGDARHEARRRNAAAQAQGESPSPLDKLRAMPVIGVLMDALSAWWANHPLQPAASVAEGVVREAAAPLARRHPLMVVTGAFVVGAAITWLRPWRLLGKTAVFAGLFSQVVSRTVMHMPWESMLGAMSSFAHAGVDDTAPPDGGTSAPEEPAANQTPAPMKEAA